MLRVSHRGPITRVHLARTFLGHPLRTVEAYLLDGLLIDSGPPAAASEMVAWCRGRQIRQVINTHHHEDHAGGDAALQAYLGIPVAAPAEALSTMSNSPRLELYRRLVWGQPRNVDAKPVGDTIETPQYRLDVIPTPGHCVDHVCLFERNQGWLFTGDLFIHERASYLRVDEDAHQILASLRRMHELRPRLLICSHAGFVEEGTEALERKIRAWEALEQRARAMREEGFTLREITDTLLGPEGLASHVSRGHFSKRNLIASLLHETE